VEILSIKVEWLLLGTGTRLAFIQEWSTKALYFDGIQILCLAKSLLWCTLLP